MKRVKLWLSSIFNYLAFRILDFIASICAELAHRLCRDCFEDLDPEGYENMIDEYCRSVCGSSWVCYRNCYEKYR